MSRPSIPPALAAELMAALPSRLMKKLDADPTVAETWTWSDVGVRTANGETVTWQLDGDIVSSVTCTCLLSPKCLHVGAVVSALPVADVVAPDPAPAVPRSETPQPLAEVRSPKSEVPTRAFAVLADVLAIGGESTGALPQSELLRTIHACRAAGLHRLAAAQTRVLRSIRDLRADKPEFALEVLASDLREALGVAHALSAGDASPGLVGTARRDYEPVGNLRLYGLFTEAIVARSGYAGAVTYLVDERGAMYSRADVAGGDARRALAAYDAPAGLGDAVLAHRELGRSGLFVSDATASADGRLGAGQRVRAVRASEPSRWSDAVIAARWATPLADQLARVATADALADDLRPAGWDLVFVEGAVASIGGRAWIGGIELVTAHDHKALPARDNLSTLARASGASLRVIGRVRVGAPRRLELLAFGPSDGETRFAWPDAWQGRANLHYDRLPMPAEGPRASGLGPRPDTTTEETHIDLVAVLRRRVERVALGGLGTLPTHALAEIDREAAQLIRTGLPTAAETLRDLAAVAHDATRAMTGARRAVDRPRFARAWLRAARFEAVARRRLAVASW